MTPADVQTLITDGCVHRVVDRQALTVTRNIGPIGLVMAEDPEHPGLQIQVQGRQANVFETVPATRYRTGCGLGFDRVDGDLVADDYFIQGFDVDCEECLAR